MASAPLNPPALNWEVVAALGACVAAVAAVAYTIAFIRSMKALRAQVTELALTRNAELIYKLYDRLIASRPLRQRLYDHKALLDKLPTLDDWDKVRSSHKQVADALLDVSMDYHFVGLLLLSNRVVTQYDAFLADIGEVYLDKVYPLVMPAIRLERQRSGSTYRATLEHLASESQRVLGRTQEGRGAASE